MRPPTISCHTRLTRFAAARLAHGALALTLAATLIATSEHAPPAAAASPATASPVTSSVANQLAGHLPAAAKIAAKPRVRPGAFNQIRITWPGITRGTRLTVVGADSYKNLLKRKARFTVRAKRTGATTAIVSIPKKFHPTLGANAGRLVYMYVYAKNQGKTKKSRMVVSWVGPRVARGTPRQRIKVATYNVGLVSSTLKVKGQHWGKRRHSVVNAVVKARPDVLAVQEAGMSRVNMPRQTGPVQVTDLANRLRAKGYLMNVSEAQIRAVIGNRAKYRGVTSFLFYRPATVRLLATGIRASGGGTAKDRYFSWAKFQSLRNNKVFYAASIHLPPGRSAAAKRLRTKQIRNWQAFMSRMAGRSPVFILGDFNTDYRLESGSAVAYLTARGWQNAAATAKKSGFQYSSVNNNARYKGYPPRPERNGWGQGTKIDHIMSKNTSGVFRYVNQVVLRKGRFVESYRGSDHNLQTAIVGIR